MKIVEDRGKIEQNEKIWELEKKISVNKARKHDQKIRRDYDLEQAHY